MPAVRGDITVAGVFNSTASITVDQITLTANHTIAARDGCFYVLAPTAAFTVVLPVPTKGRVIVFRKAITGTGAVTINRAGTAQIEGATQIILSSTLKGTAILIADGTNWFRIL